MMPGKHPSLAAIALAGALTLSASAGAADTAGANAGPAAPSPAEHAGVMLQEVTVTAEKVSQPIQTVPAAVTAVSGSVLVERNITDMSGLESLIPSVRLQHQTDITEVFIRGIGSGFDAAWLPESVATNFAGASLPRDLTGATLYDLSSVEVLPGPQGTLYGRSAVGGVININPKRPTFDRLADATINVGNFGLVNGTFVGNTPIGSALAVRAAINFDRTSGYDDDGTYSQNSLGARVSALYRPGDVLSLYLWGSYYRNKPRVAPLAYFPLQENSPYSFPRNDGSSSLYYPPDGLDNTASTGHYRGEMTGAEVKATLGTVAIAYVPTYIHYDVNDTRPIAGLLEVNAFGINQLTQELRVSNAAPGPLRYIAGVYMMQNRTDTNYVLGPFFGGGSIPNKEVSYAAYGQVSYALTAGLRLVAGGRYSSDQTKDLAAQAYFPIFNPATFQFERGAVPFGFDETWKHFNWKAGFEADVSAHSMLYGNVQTGFNPGSYDTNAIPLHADREILPQQVTAYTLGSKNQFLKGRLTANFEAFYYDYKDLILQQYNAGTGGVTIYNAPKATIKGGQIDAVYELTRNDRLQANIGLTYGRLGRFVAGGFDYSDFQLPSSADETASLGYRHIVDLRDGASIALSADTYFSSGFWGLFDHSDGSHQEAYTKSDLAVTYTPQSGRWDIGLWVKNLEDEAVLAATGESTQPYPRRVVAYAEPPRTFGMQFHARIGD